MNDFIVLAIQGVAMLLVSGLIIAGLAVLIGDIIDKRKEEKRK